MPEIVAIQAESTPIPMKSPFESARRRSTEAENVRVTVRLSDGAAGYGEASPAPYVTGEAVEDVLAATPTADAALRGLDPTRVRRWHAALCEALPHRPTSRSAVEMAVLDALTRTWGVPLSVYFGGAQESVRTDLTIPITDAATAGEIAREAAGLGYRSLKIKVGGVSRDEDLERVRAVSAGAPEAQIRLDANQAFTADEALAFIRACLKAQVRVELMEQPVPADDWDALAAVTRRSPVPVIADEAVVDAPAALRIAATGAAHGINIKVAKAGLIGSLQIIEIARAGRLRLMLGCMLESLLGIGAALHLACGTGVFDYLDLDAHTLIGLEATGLPFSQTGDMLRAQAEMGGIGWEPG